MGPLKMFHFFNFLILNFKFKLCYPIFQISFYFKFQIQTFCTLYFEFEI